MLKKIEVCSVTDVEIGKKKRFVVNGKALMVAHVDTDFFVIDDTCTHGQASLTAGCLEGTEIECPRHGGRFDVRTGEAKILPAVTPLATYKISIENEKIFVEMEVDSSDQHIITNTYMSQTPEPQKEENSDNKTSASSTDNSSKTETKPPFEVICEGGVCRIVRPPKKA